METDKEKEFRNSMGDEELKRSKLDVNKKENEIKGPKFGERHKQCLVLFACMVVAYSMRVCMGVALVAMTDPRADDVEEKPPYHPHSIVDNTTWLHNNTATATDTNHTNAMAVNVTLIDVDNSTDHFRRETEGFQTHGVLQGMLLIPPYPKFWWNKKVQDTILSSFFWGYMVLQIPGGWLAHRYGARRLLVAALGCNAVISFCLPWAAYYGGLPFIVICRLLQGLSQACIVPSMVTFLGKWSPLEERSRMVGSVSGGQALGTVVGLPLTGFLAASPLGWPGVFRFFGLLSAGTAIAAGIMLADTPRQHPRITADELRYIEQGLQASESGKRLSVPWRRILTDRAVVAIALAHVSQTYGQLTLFAELPAYMARVMGVNIKANGMLTALPFLVMWFSNFFFNWMMDFLIIKKVLSVTNTRKLANSIGSLLPAMGLVALAFVPKNLFVVEGVLVFICTFKVASNVGYLTNNVDLTPNFAGTIASLSNFLSNVIGSQAPLVAGLIVTDPTDELQWRWVFFVCAGMYIISNGVYVCLGTAERAAWDAPPEDATAVPLRRGTLPPQWRNTGARPSVASITSLPRDNMY